MKFSDALIRIGGSYWAKQGMKRISFSNLERWYGLVISTSTVQGTGASATLNGKKINPREAHQLRGHLYAAKLWYDPQAAKFVMQGTLAVMKQEAGLWLVYLNHSGNLRQHYV